MPLVLPIIGADPWGATLNTALTYLDNAKYEKSGGALTGGITTDIAVRSAFFKTTSTTQHAVTIYQAGTSGATASALNLISDNPFTSAIQVTSSENALGSIKITHRNASGTVNGDANAAALSIDLTQAGAGGTAAQGIFITSTDGGTTGRFLTLRNGGANLMTVGPSGMIYSAAGALGAMQPVDHGVQAWVCDPALVLNSSLVTNGTVYLAKVRIAEAFTATKLYWWVTAVAVTPTAGQNFVGIYNSAGTLLASTNVDADITSTGLKTTTITGQNLSSAGFYWVAMVFNAATAPTIARMSGLAGLASAVNLGLTAGTYRFATNGTSQTSLPASITPGSNVAGGFAGPWAAVGV